MPLYELVCRNKKSPHVFDVVLPVAQRDEPQPCRFCKSKATRERIVLRGFSARAEAAFAQAFKAPVVYRGKDGSLRFPGHSNSKETKRLESRGFERVELNNVSKIRQFEASMNKLEKSKYDNFIAAKDAAFNAQQKNNRDDLRQAIATGRMVMVDSDRKSPTFGQKYVGTIDEKQKDYIRTVMEQTANRKTHDPHFDAGFHLDAFSNDYSNRNEHRDVSTGWRGRKD